MRRQIPGAILLATLLGAAACGDSGIAAIRVQLQSDLSGSVTTSSLHLPPASGPLEADVQGVTWTDRATLSCAHGTFASISKLTVADIAFEGGKTDAGFSYVRVVLPRGNGVRWPTALVPPREERQRVQKTFDPRNTFGDAASLFTIEIDVPGTIIGHGVEPSARGLSSSVARQRATLAVPVDRGRTGDGAFEWHVTWK